MAVSKELALPAASGQGRVLKSCETVLMPKYYSWWTVHTGETSYLGWQACFLCIIRINSSRLGSGLLWCYRQSMKRKMAQRRRWNTRKRHTEVSAELIMRTPGTWKFLEGSWRGRFKILVQETWGTNSFRNYLLNPNRTYERVTYMNPQTLCRCFYNRRRLLVRIGSFDLVQRFVLTRIGNSLPIVLKAIFYV